MYTNVDGALSKKCELLDFIRSGNLEVVYFTETMSTEEDVLLITYQRLMEKGQKGWKRLCSDNYSAIWSKDDEGGI